MSNVTDDKLKDWRAKLDATSGLLWCCSVMQPAKGTERTIALYSLTRKAATPEDSHFIEAARNEIVPQLLDEVDRLRKVLEDIRERTNRCIAKDEQAGRIVLDAHIDVDGNPCVAIRDIRIVADRALKGEQP